MSNCYLRIFLFISLLIIGTGVLANDSTYKPTYNPSMETFKARGEIKIDGELNDPGWQGLPVADNFAEHRPGDQTKPSVDTKAMITYDDNNLYVAFICFDDPKTIRANYTDRDEMWQDDNVILLLDTYANSAWAYEIGVNPFGIQGDIIWSQYGGEDESPELIWESAGKITDSGYQVEMAIPFSSLRFPNKEKQVWKVDFWRNHPRDSRRQLSWAAYDRDVDCWPCQWGTVTGINNISPGKGIELLPTLIGYQVGSFDDETAEWTNDDIDGEASLGLKYSPSSNLTFETTINPDFSQIESDEAQISANNTFALFYSEKRPFFQEGSDLFNTWINAIYTRTINNPIGAVKAVARDDKTSVYVLSAYDEDSPLTYPQEETTIGGLAGKSYSNIARIRHSVGEQSHIGGLVTDRRFEGGGYSTTYGLDAAFYFLDNYNVEFQGLLSSTEELNDPDLDWFFYNDVVGTDAFGKEKYTAEADGEKFRGHGYYFSLERHGRNDWLDIDYNESSPTFRADNGFITQNGKKTFDIEGGFSINHVTKYTDRFDINGGYGKVWRYDDGHFKDEWIWFDLSAQLKAQTYISFNGSYSHETFGGIHFDDIYNLEISASSKFSDMFQFWTEGSVGHLIARREDPPVMGSVSGFEFGATIKPTKRLKISPSYEYFKMVRKSDGGRIFEGSIFRSRVDYQYSSKLSFRLIAEYDDFENGWAVDPLITYRLSSFSVFYLGSTHQLLKYDDYGWKESERQFFMKLQYLFRI